MRNCITNACGSYKTFIFLFFNVLRNHTKLILAKLNIGIGSIFNVDKILIRLARF
jgi:hypothetical protein